MSHSNDSTAAKRIRGLLDKDSFVEIGAFVTARGTDFNLADQETPYDNTDSLWENTIDLAVNKYLSAKMYLNLRFDDSAKKSDHHGYLQIQELISFGLSYTL